MDDDIFLQIILGLLMFTVFVALFPLSIFLGIGAWIWWSSRQAGLYQPEVGDRILLEYGFSVKKAEVKKVLSRNKIMIRFLDYPQYETVLDRGFFSGSSNYGFIEKIEE